MNCLHRMLTARNPRLQDLARRIVAKRDRIIVSRADQIEHLRAKYRRLTGKTADKRWSDATLLSKVLAAQDISPASSGTRDELTNALDSLERKS